MLVTALVLAVVELMAHGSGIRRNVNKLGGDNISHFGLIKAKTTSSLFSETILNTNILMVPASGYLVKYFGDEDVLVQCFLG